MYFLNKLKSWFSPLKRFSKSFYKGRYFLGVQFLGKKNIYINGNVNIDYGAIIACENLVFQNNSRLIIGANSWIGKNVELSNDTIESLIIGDYVSIQDRCKVLGNVKIGDYTLLAPDVYISSGLHNYNKIPSVLIKLQDREQYKEDSHFKTRVIIGEDCWIGKNVFIKPGVTIGRGAVIGANTLVSKDVLPYTVVAGTPQRVINKRLVFDPPKHIDLVDIQSLPYFYSGFDHYVSEVKQFASEGIASKGSSVIVLNGARANYLILSGCSKSLNDITFNIYINDQFLQTEKVKAFQSFYLHFKLTDSCFLRQIVPNIDFGSFLDSYNLVRIECENEGDKFQSKIFIQKVGLYEKLDH